MSLWNEHLAFNHQLTKMPKPSIIKIDWKNYIQTLSAECTFETPTTRNEIRKAEKTLSVRFPQELKDLLVQSNGAHGEYGLGLIWTINRIVKDNLSFRTYRPFRRIYMPFDNLLFFGDAGNGDQFAFRILDGVIRRKDVFVWNHEDDSRIWGAPSLELYLEWWLTGKLKI